jgi:hypothetical protein
MLNKLGTGGIQVYVKNSIRIAQRGPTTERFCEAQKRLWQGLQCVSGHLRSPTK